MDEHGLSSPFIILVYVTIEPKCGLEKSSFWVLIVVKFE